MGLKHEFFTHKGKRWERLPEEPMQRFVVGVDLGQSADYTAVAVIDHSRTPLPDDWHVDEVACRIRQRVDERFDVRHLQRLPLGTPYPEQVARIRDLFTRPPLRGGDVPLCIDQTGVGAPVGDLFEADGLRPVRITFTSGFEPTGRGRKWGVPKSTIVSGIDAKLHCGELRFAKALLEAEALKEELANFQKHVSQTGKLLFEHRSGRHDDLIFAIGIALWWTLERRKQQGHVGPVKGLI